MGNKLEGKIAVITEGASGIGLDTVKRFVSEETYVFIIDLNKKELDTVLSEISKNVSSGIKCDVSNLEDLDMAFDVVKDKKGHIGILYADAGIIQFAPLGKISEEHFDKLCNINVKGLLYTVQKALPIFRDGGSIILNASIDASKGGKERSIYHATKAAIRLFARCWTLDLRHRKICVNAASTGSIDTPFVYQVLSKEQSEEFLNKTLKSTPMGRMGSPDEVAKAVLFLASDDSSYITGIELFVDGRVAQI
jgi:NAD(P)-dependent dehydrogenase (short-subunit alcohol dehydrogenase family)